MKRMVFGLLLSAVCSVSQAGALVINNATSISFKGYDGEPASITGVETKGSWGWLSASKAGVLAVTYLGNESAYVDKFTFGLGKGSLLESNKLGATISESVGAGLLNFSFADSKGRAFSNGQQQTTPLGFAILKGQTNKYGTFDYLLGFNDSYCGDADYDDFVVGIKFTSAVAPVPEPQTYAMLLAGLGLLGLSIRRRKDGTSD